jgi:hypothetical protein
MSEVDDSVQIIELVQDARKASIKVACTLALCALVTAFPAWLSLTDWGWLFTGFFVGSATFAAVLAYGLHSVLRDEGVA